MPSNHQHCWVDDQPQQSTVQHEMPSSIYLHEFIEWLMSLLLTLNVVDWTVDCIYIIYPCVLSIRIYPCDPMCTFKTIRIEERFIAMATRTQPRRGHGLPAVFRNGLVAPEVGLGLRALGRHCNGSRGKSRKLSGFGEIFWGIQLDQFIRLIELIIF